MPRARDYYLLALWQIILTAAELMRNETCFYQMLCTLKVTIMPGTFLLLGGGLVGVGVSVEVQGSVAFSRKRPSGYL